MSPYYTAQPGSEESENYIAWLQGLAVGNPVQIIMSRNYKARTAKVVRVTKAYIITDDLYTAKYHRQSGDLVGSTNFHIQPIAEEVTQ